MRDIIIALILIAVTIGLICLIRLLTSNFRSVCRRPRVELIFYFDNNCDCLEYNIDRIYSCSALREVDLSVTVIDCIATYESRLWLEALRSKIKKDFRITTEDERDGTAEYCYDKRNG